MKRIKVFFSLGDISAAKILNEILKRLELPPFISLYGITDEKLSEKIHSIGSIEDINITGLLEIISKLGKIWDLRKKVMELLKDIDVLILLDAPGFNLPLLKKAKTLGVKKTIYFILPQVWAWGEKRKEIIGKYCDVAISIIPFEEDIYKEYYPNLRFYYFGHPLIDILEKETANIGREDVIHKLNLKKRYFVVFPGSRKNEIKAHLKTLVKAGEIIAKKHNLEMVLITFKKFEKAIRSIYKGKIFYVEDKTLSSFAVIKYAQFGWIKSGTTALATALLHVPHLIFYKVNPITYLIARRLVKVKYLHLVNITLDKAIVPELIQHEFNVQNLIRITEKELLLNSQFQKKYFEQAYEIFSPYQESVLSLLAKTLQKEILEI
jgi:lipid-A-disaccharide synthase